MPILTAVGTEAERAVDWYVEGVRCFIDAYQTAPHRILKGRIRPLLAIPLVGSGKGGAAERVAELIRQLIVSIHGMVQDVDVDVVLVVKNPFHYSVCQMARKRLNSELNFWSRLTEHQLHSAENIAGHARKGNLVLFLGAGVSAGAGAPSWGGLLDSLADLGKLGEDKKKALSEFNYLDQAEILKKNLAKAGLDMNKEIVRLLSEQSLYSLSHALISDWPVNEAVTQNYDTMFESSCRDSGQPLSVIPYSFEEDTDKWLLKMHGCINQPEDIVLSRNDYLDYDYSRSALSGIVQALLVTKHMLFLGFSLTDDHFIQLIFGVHKAVEGMVKGDQSHKFGTVMTLLRSPMQEDLWSRELDSVSAGEPGDNFSGAVSTHDIMLDYTTAMAHTSHAYLFHDEYELLMEEDERALRDSLRVAWERVKTLNRSETVGEFRGYLSRLGWDDA